MRKQNIPNGKKAPSPTAHFSAGLTEFSQLAESVALVTDSSVGMMTLASCQAPKRRAWRKQYQFWLEDEKQDHIALGWWIEGLKKTRSFAPIIRKALALYRELMEGEFTMLYQLFPNTKPPPLPVTPEKIKEMEDELTILRKEVDLLTGILIKQQSPGAVNTAVKMEQPDTVGQGRPPRPYGTSLGNTRDTPVTAAAPVVSEADTSSSFLDMF